MSVNKSFRKELDPKNRALTVVSSARKDGTNSAASVSKDLATSDEARRGPNQQAGRKMVALGGHKTQGNHWRLSTFTPKSYLFCSFPLYLHDADLYCQPS